MNVTEAYSVATRLTITGDATKKLSEFTRGVKRASEATETLLKRMRPLNDQFLKSSEILSKLNPRLTRFGETFLEVRSTLTRVNDSFTGLNRRLETSGARMDSLIAKTGRLRNQLNGLSGTSHKVGAMPARGAASSAASESSLGVGALSLAFPAVGGAMAAYSVAKGSYEGRKEYLQARAEFAAMGLGGAQNAQAENFIKNNTPKGSSQIEAYQALRDLVVVTGSLSKAEQSLPLIMRMKFGNQAVFNKDMSESQLNDMLKVIEIRGGFKSPEAMAQNANFFNRVLAAEGGAIQPSDFLDFMKTGGVAAQMISERGLVKLTPLAQELGGARLGTAFTSASQAIENGMLSTASAKRLQELGLIKKGGAEYNKIGMIKRVKPGGVEGSELFASDPVAWMQTVYLPALAKKGITSEKGILSEIAYDFKNRTASSLLSKMFLQYDKIMKFVGIYDSASDIDSLYGQGNNTPGGKEKALSSAYADFKNALGAFSEPAVIKGMEGLTKLLDKLTTGLTLLGKIDIPDWFKDNAYAPERSLSFTDKALAWGYKKFHNADSVNPGSPGGGAPTGHVYMDKSKVGALILDYAAKQANKSPAYGANFDPSMSFTPVMLNR